MILLSIIIPVYNGQKYLEQAIKSVLKQNFHQLEIIIINDGSTDNSLSIAKKYSENYSFIHTFSIDNSGVSVARNTGIDKAKGKYIGFLDADDVLCNNAVTPELVSLLESDQDIIAMQYFNSTENLKKGKPHRISTEGVVLPKTKNYFKYSRLHLCSYLYRRSLISELDAVFPEGIKHEEDKVFLYQMTKGAKSMYLYPNYWFVYRNNPDSVMNSNYKIDYIIDDNINAWIWLRNRHGEKSYAKCDQRIFTHMAEYITLATLYGVPLAEIEEKVNACEEFGTALQNYDKYPKAPHIEKEYIEFSKSPKDYYRSKLPQRTIRRFINLLRKNNIIKNAYLHNKYKVNISEYSR